MKKHIIILLAFSTLLYTTSCNSLTKAQKGAAIGAGAGGAVGAGVGKATGNTALGAILGASIGGIAGGIIGKRMDKQANEISEIPGAQVERVGEGINVTFDSGILFETNEAKVAEASKTRLEQLASVLKKYPDTYILIEGHTDASGSTQYNEKLSKKRADAVADYLSDQDIADNRLITKWYGEEQPKFPNDTAENMAKNRRVEFAIYANESLIENAKQEAGSR